MLGCLSASIFESFRLLARTGRAPAAFILIANSTTTRPRCPQCLRALRGCICALVQPVHSHVQVLILQHPLEVHEAKNTARLLHLCLGASSRIEVGEAFDPAQLHALLHMPWHSGDAPRQPVLLYPQTPDSPAPMLDASACHSTTLRLVVIDGTWRKSRKMLYTNPLLQALPRLAFTEVTGGNYRIRKAHRPDQLSTMEAVTQALAQWHGWTKGAPQVSTLLDSFAELMRLQMELNRLVK